MGQFYSVLCKIVDSFFFLFLFLYLEENDLCVTCEMYATWSAISENFLGTILLAIYDLAMTFVMDF